MKHLRASNGAVCNACIDWISWGALSDEETDPDSIRNATGEWEIECDGNCNSGWNSVDMCARCGDMREGMRHPVRRIDA